MTASAKNKALNDPLAAFMAFQLRRASISLMMPVNAALADLGFKMSDATLLMFIASNPGCNQSQIGRALNISRPNLVPVVSALVDAGLVNRGKRDGRTNTLRVTDAGQEVAQRIFAANQAIEDEYFSEMSTEERAAFASVLVRLRETSLRKSGHSDDNRFMHIKH